MGLWVISCWGFTLLFVCSASGVWFYKPILILLWFGVFRFLFFIEREFHDQVTMFMASYAYERDLLVIDALDPFLISEFKTYGFWEFFEHIHLYTYSCIRCISPF
jgi:hypothetical protein